MDTQFKAAYLSPSPYTLDTRRSKYSYLKLFYMSPRDHGYAEGMNDSHNMLLDVSRLLW